MPEKSSPSPFLIWTLQRTGGTNLANRLFWHGGYLSRAQALTESLPPTSRELLDLIPDPWKLHKPFNMHDAQRPLGVITEKLIDSDQGADGLSRLNAFFSLRLPIKHCVEMVPPVVNERLAHAAAEAGFRHLFLYRRNPVCRLLSLYFAEQSGVWGAQFRDQSATEEEIFSTPLPVAQLVDRENNANERLQTAWNLLGDLNSPRMAIAYEDIYLPQEPAAGITALLPVLDFLGLAASAEADRDFLEDVLRHGDQGTRDKYSRFQGIALLEKALSTIPQFAPI